MIDLELSIVRPLAHNCLSYPSGLAISKNEKILYVSETSKNRIIRFVLSP
jgi:sugar lactone lactonase YvrE